MPLARQSVGTSLWAAWDNAVRIARGKVERYAEPRASAFLARGDAVWYMRMHAHHRSRRRRAVQDLERLTRARAAATATAFLRAQWGRAAGGLVG